MNVFVIYLTELRRNIRWHIIWLIFLLTYAIWIYNLWLTFLIPILVIVLLIYTMTSGVRGAIQTISDKTGELLYSLPVARKKFLVIHLLANFTPIMVFFFLQFLIMSIHSFGPEGLITQNKILVISLWGIFFGLFGLLFGASVGIFTGNTAKGYQMSIIAILISYVMKTVIQMNPGLNVFSDINPLIYYQPDQYLLFKSFVKNATLFTISFPFYPVILIILILFFLFMSLHEFDRKDLTDDASVHINFIRKYSLNKTQEINKNKLKIIYFVFSPFIIVKNILFPKNVRNNPLVFWARIFENRLPLTADFIFSDNIILFIAVFTLFLLFPFQLSHYPGDVAVLTSINTFGQAKIFSVFTYGHNLDNNPYLWFLCVNSIGLLWVIFFPLSFLWVIKAFLRDSNSGYGEIFGGLAIDNIQAVIHRIFAIIFELIFLDFVAIFWLLITEILNGQTYDKIWEIISIICLLPLYIFIIAFSGTLTLFLKDKGLYISGTLLAAILCFFILSILTNSSNIWFIGGIFNLYDPILIIEEKSLTVNGNGILILIIIDIFSIIGLIKSASNYTWVNIRKNKQYRQFLPEIQ